MSGSELFKSFNELSIEGTTGTWCRAVLRAACWETMERFPTEMEVWQLQAEADLLAETIEEEFNGLRAGRL